MKTTACLLITLTLSSLLRAQSSDTGSVLTRLLHVIGGMPDSVILISPLNGESAMYGDSITIKWQRSYPDVDHYWLEYAFDPLFQFVVIDSALVDTLKGVRTFCCSPHFLWKVRARNSQGWGRFSEVRHLQFYFSSVQPNDVPFAYALEQNYPNPFNPTTTIRYGLPNRSHVTLTVFNTLGQAVAVLQNGEQETGYHEVKCDGSRLSSGVYFYRLQAGVYLDTKKLILTK